MYVAHPEDDTQRTTLLLRAPAIFGDRDLLADCPARESAAALTPSRLLIFDREAFFAAWREPAFADRIARDLAARSAMTAVLASLGLSPLPHRIALMMRGNAGASVEYLAEIACTTQKSVARALTELKKDPIEPLPEISTIFHSLK